jgi:hypothetical protein
MQDKIEKAIESIKEATNLLLLDGWEYAQIGVKEWAVPREEYLFAVSQLHKFEGSLPCIINFRSTPIGSEIEVTLDFPPELDKFKYIPEYTNTVRTIRVPVIKGGKFIYEKLKSTLPEFYEGYKKAYSLYRGEIELKKLKLTLIKRLAEIFNVELGELDYEKSEHEFSALIERKSIGPTIQIGVKTDSSHNVSLNLKNLTEEEGVKILLFLHTKNSRHL